MRGNRRLIWKNTGLDDHGQFIFTRQAIGLSKPISPEYGCAGARSIGIHHAKRVLWDNWGLAPGLSNSSAVKSHLITTVPIQCASIRQGESIIRGLTPPARRQSTHTFSNHKNLIHGTGNGNCHSLTVPSALPDTTCRPLAGTANACTARLWPVKISIVWPLAMDQTRIIPSASLDTS